MSAESPAGQGKPGGFGGGEGAWMQRAIIM